MLCIVDIQGQLAGHLLVAMRRHREDLRRVSGRVPDEFAELERVLIQASKGHDETTLHRLGSVLDDRAVSLLLTRSQAGHLLGVSERTVSRMIAEGALPAVKVLGATRIRRDDVDQYVAKLQPELSPGDGAQP